MADFDGDGHLDLMTSDGFDATFLLGNGDGTFPSEDYVTFTGPAPKAAALTDFNEEDSPTWFSSMWTSLVGGAPECLPDIFGRSFGSDARAVADAAV